MKNMEEKCRMHSNHAKNQDSRNSAKLNDENNICNLEAVGERCNFSRNVRDSITDVISVSSFTHESQKERNVTEDITERLIKKLNSKPQDVIQGIKNYDKLQTGKILPGNLYNVLRIFCVPLSLKEFESLIKEERVDENGFLSYKPFLSNFISDEKKFNDLWMTKEISSDISSLSTEDLEITIKNKISKNIKNFIRCMWLHDFNNDGLIQKEDLKTVLDNICFPLSDDQFNRFWYLYDPINSGIINYKDFLMKLGTHTESYKRILPQNKKIRTSVSHSSKYSRHEQLQLLCAKLGRDDPSIQGQFFNNIVDVFKERVKKEFPLLMRTLRIKDSSGSGFIHLSVFHQVLNYFVMPMSFQLFKEILRSFNVSPNNSKIAWYSFLKKVCVNNGVKCETTNSPMQGSINWKICKSILEKLKRNGKNEDNFFKNAFTMPTQNQKMAVTRAELRKVINQSLILPVNEEEFKSLMFILDPGHTNFIDCENFLSLFQIVNEDKGNQNSKLPDEDNIENKNQNVNLRGEKLKVTFKKCFNKSFKNIEKALYAFDSEETGAINVDDFKKILDVFCFPLTEKQFCEILSDFTTTNKIFYGDFINFYRKSPYEDEEKWKSCIKRLISTKVIPKQKLTDEEILKYVQDIVLSNKDVFLQEFQDADLCNTGSVRKEFFSKILHKYVFRLTDEQFQLLWEKLPKNEIGFLKYPEFLDEWCKTTISTLRCKGKTPCASRSNSIVSITSKNSSRASLNSKERPRTASSVLSLKSSTSKEVNNRPKSASSVSQQSLTKSNSHLSVNGRGLENCGILTKEQYKQYKSLDFSKMECLSRPASKTKNNRTVDKPNENKIQDRGNYQKDYEITIKTRWRDILRRCKASDQENHDIILWDDFLSILQRTGIDTNDDTIKSLETKYKIKRDFPVNYWTFLKKFLIRLNSDQNIKVNDVKEWTPKQIVSGHESVGLCKVLLNYHDKILKNYRDLYHAFRRADPQHTGEIKTLEFRKILTFHKIYMTDHDLFYIQDYFDPKLSEKIPYDKFLKSFIKK